MTKYKRKAAIHKYIKGPILSLPLSILMSPSFDRLRKEKPTFSGKREKRGLYRAKNGRRINADVNGSYNILRQAFPNSFSLERGQGILGPASSPPRLAV